MTSLLTSYSVVQVNSNYPNAQVVVGSGNPVNAQQVLVYNSDPSTTIYLGATNAFTAGDTTQSTPLLPQSSVTFDGTADVFAGCINGQVAALYVYPTGSSFAGITGTELLFGEGSGATPAFTIGASSIDTVISLVDVTLFQSYDINMYAWCPNQNVAGAPLTMLVQLQWFDDTTSGQPVYQESWWIWVGSNNPANLAFAIGNGKMHGKYLTIRVQNTSIVEPITMQTMRVYGSTRVATISNWRQPPPLMTVSPGNFNYQPSSSSVDGYDDILAQVNNQALADSANYFIPIALFPGPVWYRMLPSGAWSTVPVVCHAAGLLNNTINSGIGAANIVHESPMAGGEDEILFNAPRAPLFLAVSTTSSGNAVTMTTIAKEGQ